MMKMKLHEAIETVLKEAGHSLRSSEIANRINNLKLYQRGDGNPLPSSQINARVNNYLHLFIKNPDGTISLRGYSGFRTAPRPVEPKVEKSRYADMVKESVSIEFDKIEDLKKAGFSGFLSIAFLKGNHSMIPAVGGVYMVIRKSSSKPGFLKKGSGGFFKDRDPNVPVSELESNWVEGTCVLYIGKAGGTRSSSTLNKRLGQYLRFGDGCKVGHWGGRYIWQLEDHDDLLLCWKPDVDQEPEEYETELIDTFRKQYGKRPFANLAK